MCSLEGGSWKSTYTGNSLATYPTPNSPEEVVGGMIEIFAKATEEDTGKYYEWTGEELPW